MKKPKVTIIIPVYNTEKYLIRCLNSVRNQTIKDVEIIYINDGSTDKSLDILKKLKKSDKRIILMNKKNGGQASARNLGIKHAHGEYIGFVDSDDWIDLDYYEKMYDTAKKNDADMVMASMNYLKTNERYYDFKKEETFTEIKDKLKISKIDKWGSVCVCLFKRDMLSKNKILFDEGMYYEDILFVLKSIFFCNKLATTPKTGYFYANNPTSTVNTITEKKILDLYKARKDSIDFAKKHGFKIYFRFRGKIPLPLFAFNILTKIRILIKKIH